jgi:mediator of RNA polymerase II transcription subunit 22
MSQGNQAKALPQAKEAQLKSYQKRLKDDVRSMADNFLEILKVGKSEADSTDADKARLSQVSRPAQAVQDFLEVEVRAANMVRAAESMMKLVSDIKQFLILNDFMQVNDSIKNNSAYCASTQNRMDSLLLSIRDELAIDLYDLEDEYYSSQYK